jgi:hypothetical protein
VTSEGAFAPTRLNFRVQLAAAYPNERTIASLQHENPPSIREFRNVLSGKLGELDATSID